MVAGKDLVVMPEIEKALMPLNKEENEMLKENCLKNGIIEPLITWRQNGQLALIDGHHRYRIAQKYNLPFTTMEKKFKNIDDVLLWIFRNQLGRRNLTDEQRTYILGRYYKKLKQKQGRPTKDENKKVVNFSTFSGSTAKAIAKAAGTNEKTVRNAEKFADAVEKLKQINPKAAEKVLLGKVEDAKTALPKIFKNKNIEKKEEEIAERIVKADKKISINELNSKNKDNKLDDSKYDVIVVNPPWPYRIYYPDDERVECPYPEIPLGKLKNLTLPAKKDSILFIWTSHHFLPYAFKIVKYWGFEYKTTLVWNRQQIKSQRWFKAQVEFCLFAIRGRVYWNNTKWKDIIVGSASSDFEKPDIFFDMVDATTIGKKLDYFPSKKRKNWDSFGIGFKKIIRS